LIPLVQRRTFRSHLGRWDWEPYGLLLHRDALKYLKIEPVVYGDEADYGQLPTQHRTLFQPSQSTTGKGSIDWREEREWRHVGDLDLSNLNPAHVICFVATRQEAIGLSRYCDWPVVWLS
jgi:hypothetical protein